MGAVLILILVAAALIAGVILSSIAARKRREALAAIAARLNLRYHQGDPFGLPTVYAGTAFCSQGHSRRAYNVVAGPIGCGEARFFDYQYKTTVHTKHGTREVTHYRSGCGFHAPYRFKRLVVRPEGFFDKVAGFLGFDDIDLDLAEFNKSFYVSSEDKKFAYDVLSQKAMEFFLARRGITMETGWDYLLFYYGGGTLRVEEVAALISTAAAFCELLPDYLKQELSPR